MIKKLLAIGALAIAFPAQAVTTVVFTPGPSPLPGGLTVVQNFNGPLGAIPGSTNAFIVTGNSSTAAQPAFNVTGNYAAILGKPVNGMYTFTFAQPTAIFSFVLGSLDTYNKLTLFKASGGPEIFTGGQITAGGLANGNQVLPNTNGRVTYTVGAGDALITGVRFESIGQNSFEIEDIAAAVPEPSTWLMMLMGFAAVGFSMRRKQNLRPSFA